MDEKPESTHLARRAFLKNAARFGFALPVITTFTMSGISEPPADYRATSGNQPRHGFFDHDFGHDFGHGFFDRGFFDRHRGGSANQTGGGW
ncbi:hypothetical protein [Mycobacterium sp.]|jgi:hypothetical protein|uniref:hypothetical protein n=1 Tax=Mycobacterium sp. TaxID=1785 RepID=UPI002D279231|nr:hypothetical protein [Mycobacterium sp.]HZA10047.1 hypothetical protein [Mycobacterium sp.]